MVQLSQLYVITGKTTALATGNFVSKVISLLFNIPCRFVIAFLPWSKRLLILWLQSPSTVILELKKIKSVTFSTFSPSISHEVMGLDATIFAFRRVLSQLFYSPLSPSLRGFLRYKVIVLITIRSAYMALRLQGN